MLKSNSTEKNRDRKLRQVIKGHSREIILAKRYARLELNQQRLFVKGRQHASAKKASITDSLTGAHNRLWGEENFKSQLANAQRNNQYIAFIMLDLDYFKSVNDMYGHGAGDDVLRETASRIIKPREGEPNLIRDNDAFFRFGGEEFCFMATVNSPEDALQFAERIRKGMGDRTFKITDNNGIGKDIPVTASLGVTLCDPQNDQCNINDMKKKADMALYKSKKNGRNRVSMPESDLNLPAKKKVRPHVKATLTSDELAHFSAPMISEETEQKKQNKIQRIYRCRRPNNLAQRRTKERLHIMNLQK